MTLQRWAARWTRNPWPAVLVGLCLSLLAHLALLVTLALPRFLPLPHLPIEVQILPPRKKPAVPPLQPAGDSAPPTPATAKASPQKRPARPPRPKTPAKLPAKLKDRSADKTGLAKKDAAPTTPGELAGDDASVAVMLRMASLRISPHRPAIAALLDAFPDARIIAAGTDLKTPRALSSFLLDQLHGLLITTADLRLLSGTVLIAVHDPDLDLRQRLAGRISPAFDPRQLFQAEPGLTVYAREALLKGWLLDPQGRLSQGFAAKLRALTQRQDAAVVAELRHLDRLVQLGGVPTPTQLVLSLSAQARPAVLLHLEFASEAEAGQLGGAWPALQERLSGQLLWLGLGGLLDDLHVAVKDRTVEVAGSLPGADVDRLLGFLAALLPPVPLPAPVNQDPADQDPPPVPANQAPEDLPRRSNAPADRM